MPNPLSGLAWLAKLASKVEPIVPAQLAKADAKEFSNLARRVYLPEAGKAEQMAEILAKRADKAPDEVEAERLKNAVMAANYRAKRHYMLAQAAENIGLARARGDDLLRSRVLRESAEEAPQGLANFYDPGYYGSDPFLGEAAYLEHLGATGDLPGTGRVLLRSVGEANPESPLVWQSLSAKPTVDFYKARGAEVVSPPEGSIWHGADTTMPIFRIDRGDAIKKAKGGRVSALQVIKEELPKWWRDPQQEDLRNVVEAVVPTTPEDLALTIAGGPVGKAVRMGALGAYGALYSPEAEAGKGAVMGRALTPFMKELLQQGKRVYNGALDLLDLGPDDLRRLAKQPAQGDLVYHGNTAPLDLSKVTSKSPLYVASRPAHGLRYATPGTDGTPALHVFSAPKWKELPLFPERFFAWDRGEADDLLIDQLMQKSGGFRSAPNQIEDYALALPRSQKATSKDILTNYETSVEHGWPQAAIVDAARHLQRRAQGGSVSPLRQYKECSCQH